MGRYISKKMMSFIASTISIVLVGCTTAIPTDSTKVDRVPTIFPDYVGTTIPYNIAPLNFIINEEGAQYIVDISVESDCDSRSITISSSDGAVDIPIDRWHSMVSNAKGGAISVTIFSKEEGHWLEYNSITIAVDSNSIDNTLLYRKIMPGYELWREMGLYQRDLTTFNEQPIVETGDGKISKGRCVNCHTIDRNSPSTLLFHMRGDKNGTALFSQDGGAEWLPKLPEDAIGGATYPAYHPDGDIIAFSLNSVRQMNHTVGKTYVEVFDLASDLIIYSIKDHKYIKDSLCYQTKPLETFPCWDRSGEYLYFCQADSCPAAANDLVQVRYNLMRMPFDKQSMEFGAKELIVDAASMGKSISFPRISHEDGAIMVTMSDYGNFSIWHKESDLYVVDVNDRTLKKLSANSNDVDSYHSWSSSDRWFVFSSKRLNGMNSQPYICYIDSMGVCGKPFILPQQDPNLYLEELESFNIPELSPHAIPYLSKRITKFTIAE